MSIPGLYLLLGFFAIVTSYKIIFPIENNLPTNCTLPGGTPGVCRNINDCFFLRQRRGTPQTCYFNIFDHFICCPDPPKFETIELSPSAKFCDDLYPLVFAIVHGTATKYNEFYYMAALGWETTVPGQYEYKCGGALVAYNFVLTAAHCAFVNGLEPSVVLIGGVNLTDTAVEVIKISKVIIHPDYKRGSAYHDIALLQLETHANQKPACIWENFNLKHNNVTAVGYGHTRFAGAGSDQLLKADLSIISNSACQLFYTPQESLSDGIVNTQICAKDPEKLRDTCQGDSGGPIVSEGSQFHYVPYVVGITSFGHSCAGKPPGVYTRVSSYIQWIEDVIWPKQA